MKQFVMIALLFLCLCAAGSDAYAFAGNPLLPYADIVIDVGHGGVDSGARFGKYQEKDMNLAISKKTYKLLQKKGYRVIINRTDDYALSQDNKWSFGGRHRKDLAQRAGIANTIKPKMMLSMHINWSNKPDRRGPIVFHQNQSESILLANLLQTSLNRVYGTDEQPILGKKYYVLRNTKCPSVIVELGFISNRTDRKLLNSSSHQSKLAEAVTRAVDEYFAMVHKSPTSH
ncbi:N-acetylmuramoyl-L-alanine amidase family protein [Paenibacillus planticolens]|uniref:N-acetylmuramoyl-L-alanine amidase n=1 Tax=Paenibacillus planticolens TaxID=2654976 RepID=A0ABX1ZVZ9_9BACL|nr:N-acetylmuramoyl-L-alanine amidase [Paenibacillus planticolens]NOV04043.1 N-acetylmuramoyl-L-alanine amidase [Paenibacillus planticolens]